MLAVAIRIAQRMGIHNEAGLSKCTALEAEMRRRLWWSLMLFDTRISEMADLKTTTLVPTWDCRIPLNVNDSDFSIETKQPVQAQGKTTEALFAVVRSELGDFVRHTRFHLGFTDPALKPVAKDVQSSLNPEDSELASLEEMIEDKYFRFCDPEDPLHYMTIWTTRSYLAKCRLIEHYFRHSNSPAPQKELQRDASISYALTILECDTKIMTSSLTRGFHWLMSAYFPFPAYIHIVQSLKRQQVDGQAEKAWEAMSDNYEARFGSLHPSDNHPFFKVFTKIILQAWEARETASIQTEQTLATPRIVSSIRQKVSDVMPPGSDIGQPGSADMGIKTFPMSMPIGLEAQDNYAASETYPEMPGLDPLDVDLNQLDWSAMDWDLVNLSAGKSTDFWPPS